MRNLLLAAATIAASLSFTSCTAGPHQLRRSVDDLDHKLYVKSPWLSGILWFVPAFPIMTYGSWIVDSLTTDPYCFWYKDAWDGKGTGFIHYTVEATDGRLGSLLNDSAGWFKNEK